MVQGDSISESERTALGLHLRSRVGLVLLVLVLGGCGGDALTCSADEDCREGEVCVTSGGIFYASGVCMPILEADGGSIADAGGRDARVDADCIPKTCRVLATCGASNDGCGREIVCNACFDVLESGGEHTCSLSAGRVYCWGKNDKGQLGDGTTENRFEPVALVGIADPVVGLSCGVEHCCGLTDRGAVWCWGANDVGQLGNALISVSSAPALVTDLMDVAELGAGDRHSCARTSAGTLYCWGANGFGQLGSGTTVNAALPVAVATSESAIDLAVGADHACLVATGKTASCWGRNGGRLGNGTTDNVTTPVVISSLSGIDALSLGGLHTCALVSGTLWCWGDNTNGALLSPNPGSTLSPVMVSRFAPGTVSHVASGHAHVCAKVSESGTDQVWCWGEGSAGQTGLTPGSMVTVDAQLIASLSDVSRLSLGKVHTCALTRFGEVYCWGDNAFGQLGTGGQTSSYEPAAVTLGDLAQASCAPENDVQFCERNGAMCGVLVGADNCGQSRTAANCGVCTAPEVCGALEPNQCAEAP
jgi:alpha-tubulin suppressor-like RCC1 family protein